MQLPTYRGSGHGPRAPCSLPERQAYPPLACGQGTTLFRLWVNGDRLEAIRGREGGMHSVREQVECRHLPKDCRHLPKDWTMLFGGWTWCKNCGAICRSQDMTWVPPRYGAAPEPAREVVAV